MPSLDLTGYNQAVKRLQQQERQQRVDSLVNPLAEIAAGGGDVTQTPEFQQLAIIDPQRAQAIQNNALQNVQNRLGLDNARTSAMFTDAQVTRGLLDADQGRALNFLDGRVNLINQIGGNPSDTLEVRNLIAGGDVSGAKKLLDDVIRAGQQSGFLQAPTGTPKKTVGQTGLVFDPATGSFTLDQTAAARIDALAAKKNEKGGLGAKDRQSINKDITGFIKDADSIKGAAEDLEVLKNIGSGPAAVAAVFKFMKVLDPASVVKEDEFATAENSAGVPQAIRNMFNRLQSGERLGQSQFDQFINTAQGLANSAISSAQENVDGYLTTFEDTLPKSFVTKVRQRAPTLFEIQQPEPVQAQAQGNQQQVFEVDF